MMNRCILFCLVFALIACEKPSPDKQPASDPSKAVIEAITPEAAATLLQEEETVAVIDVRTPEEFGAGHIDGAINVDFMGADFEGAIGKLDKSVPYIMHCASGGRSGKALPKFKSSGFTTIYHLDAGFNGWKERGLPVTQ